MKAITSRELQRAAERLQRACGPGVGFAIMIWDAGKLNHVTNDAEGLANMMARQLSAWAQETIAENRRAMEAARSASAQEK